MTDNPGGLIYGTILVAALLAAESTQHETYPRTVAAAALALVLYWLASAYAAFAGARALSGRHFTLSGYRHALAHEAAVIVGALGPLLALLVCWAVGVGLGIAVDVALWTAAFIIAATELAIGIRSSLSGAELVVQTGFGIVLGVLVVVLRVILH